MQTKKYTLRKKRHNKIVKRIKSSNKPRLIVFRSLNNNYAQILDDSKKVVIVASSDLKDKSKGTKVEKAKKVGLEISKKALEKNIQDVVFDRNGYKYHGRVKAVAEGAREGGLKF